MVPAIYLDVKILDAKRYRAYFDVKIQATIARFDSGEAAVAAVRPRRRRPGGKKGIMNPVLDASRSLPRGARRRSAVLLAATLTLAGTLAAPAHAFQQPPTTQTPPGSEPAAKPEPTTAPPLVPTSGEAAAAPVSDAEKLARLQRSVEETTRQLTELRAGLEDPASEYAQAEREFVKLDTELQELRSRLQLARDESNAEAVAETEEALSTLTPRHQLAKERFDLAIQDRKARRDQIVTLETRLQQDTEALRKLRGEEAPAPKPVGEGDATPPVATTATTPAQPAAAETKKPAAGSVPTLPGVSLPSAPAPAEGETPQTITPTAPPSKELVEARESATQKSEEARQAQADVETITERIAALTKSIELERKLFDTARQRVDNAQQTERTLYDELQQKRQAAAPEAELADLRRRIGDARERLAEAQRESRERTDRIAKMQSDLASLQAEHIAALEEARSKEAEAEAAQKAVEKLENPWSMTNLIRFAMDRGPRVATVLIGMFALLWVVRLLELRIVRLLTRRSEHGTVEDQENRARTLVGVFRSATTVAIYAGGILMLLSEVGINIVPLMGGAAVLGLAVAFGAQNLIRDYFYGFMIILENQYTVNDVVKIGDASGQVERITLRVTVLRGLDGTVHFVPNGEITRVSNLTHGWSRALLDIGVAYKEDADRVMEVMMEIGRELRRDPDFRGMIMEMPEMLGVDALGDSAVVVRMLMKTRPLKQWAVKREMLRRIKRRFDELGIEIPFPHRTVFHRWEDGGDGSNGHSDDALRAVAQGREVGAGSPAR